MISRKSTLLLAKAFAAKFMGTKANRLNLGSPQLLMPSVLMVHTLREFMYVNDFDSITLTAFMIYDESSHDLLVEYIKTLHLLNQQDTIAHFAEKYLSTTDRNMTSTGLLGGPGWYTQVERSLELDGYVFKGGKLHRVENAVIDQERESGFLESLITDSRLHEKAVTLHCLQLANENYINGKWDDCCSNSRKVVEIILRQIAYKIQQSDSSIPPIPEKDYHKAEMIRQFLAKHGFLNQKEREGVQAIYGLLSDTGGHPHIAIKEEARLTLNACLNTSQYLLYRLEGFLKVQSKKATVP